MTVEPQRVRDFMTTSPITVTTDTEVMRVINLLVQENVSGLMVVNDSGEFVGMVTERDCIQIALQVGYFDEVGGSIADYMSTDIHVVHPDDSLMAVGELFAKSPFRQCPVIENDKLIGLICRRDVLSAITGGAWFSQE